MIKQTYTVEEAAKVLGIGRTVAYRLAREGKLPTLRLGGAVRIPIAALDELLASAKPAAKGNGHE